MKFHCDRCKTKYSISDDRVRGKILKIRCKNCSAVITVREPQSAEAEASKPVDQAPKPAGTAGEQALAGAFKQALNEAESSPTESATSPVSLDAEWYVSKDGNQEGPFTLDEATGWIAGKTPDDELYCWSEGFDDWLPVEKVSHFRGIRISTFSDLDSGDEQTMIDGPMPYLGSVPAPAAPQPLFAATMAAVAEKQAVALDDEVHMPASQPVLAPLAAVTPPIPADSRGATVAESSGAAFPADPGSPGLVVASPAAARQSGELDIGEASRVVDLAALMASRGNAPANGAMRASLPGTTSRGLGAGSGSSDAISQPSLEPVGATEPPIPDLKRRKRTSLVVPLLGAGAVILAGTLVLVFLMSRDESGHISRGSVGGGGNLGYSFRGSAKPTKSTVQPTVAQPVVPTKRVRTVVRPIKKDPKTVVVAPRPVSGEVDLTNTGPRGPTGPLDADDLMRVYRKNEIAIKRCYENSLKKDPLLRVPKTMVNIEVGLNGRVRSVKIASLGRTPLGACMISRIKRWKFRPTTEVFTSHFPVVFGR